MKITVKFKLEPTTEQFERIVTTLFEYIRLVNRVVAEYVSAGADLKYSSKDVIAPLPSALKNQAIQDAKSVFFKYRKRIRANERLKPEDQKTIRIPILKKPVAIWNNQNYALKGEVLSVPVLIQGRSRRIETGGVFTKYQSQRLQGKLGSLRITQAAGKLLAQISVEASEKAPVFGQAMGIDLGLKIPAVAVAENGRTRFFGNGRQNKFIKRRHRSVRRKLGKLKKLSAIRKRHDKEQRWMKDADHKISRQIVEFAKETAVSMIRMEKLSGIRQTARTSRKNEKNLHTWSFYRLAGYVEYKAKLAGLRVEYVDPKHTSQQCPCCKKLNKAKDRSYVCGCGYKAHRDRVGAINIISATVADGHSLPAQTATTLWSGTG